jgi:hypothetical protein
MRAAAAHDTSWPFMIGEARNPARLCRVGAAIPIVPEARGSESASLPKPLKRANSLNVGSKISTSLSAETEAARAAIAARKLGAKEARAANLAEENVRSFCDCANSHAAFDRAFRLA